MSGDIVFGSYDIFSPAPRDATARLRITCPKGTGPQVTISKGNSPTYAAREMRSGPNVLRYNLYLDPGFQLVWGDGTDGSTAFTAPPGNSQTQIYARIPAGQDVAAGSYADTLVVTIFL